MGVRGLIKIPGIEVFAHRVGHMVSEDQHSLLFPMFFIKISVYYRGFFTKEVIELLRTLSLGIG